MWNFASQTRDEDWIGSGEVEASVEGYGSELVVLASIEPLERSHTWWTGGEVALKELIACTE